jgi:hypothetical protein
MTSKGEVASGRRWLKAIGAAGALLLSGVPALAQARLPVLGLGYEYDLGGGREEFLLPDPLVDPSVATDHPLYVRVRAPWTLLEPRKGVYDWSEVDRIVDPYRAANFVPILCLYGRNESVDPEAGVPSSARGEVLKSWLEFTRAAALHFRGRVKYYEVWDEPNREDQWQVSGVSDFAYLLKNTSVTIRSADPGALIAQGGLAIGGETLDADLAWQEALYRQGIAVYVDVLPVHPPPGADLGRVLAGAYDVLLEHDPSAQLWATAVGLRGDTDRDRASEIVEKFIVGQGEGAAVVTFDLEADVEGQPEFPGVLLDLHKLFIPTYSRVPGASVTFEPFDESGQGVLSGITAYRFFDAASFQGLVGFFSRTPPETGRARMVIDTAAVRGVVVYDIIGGVAGPIARIKTDFKSNTTRVPVFVHPRPQVLQYSRVPIKGFEVEKEEVEVKETGLITAEEVMANHQRFMADQNYRLKHYRAEALLTYHGKLGGSDTVDISFENNFYLDRSAGAEWEQKALYFNGVRWKGKKLPELPIPQPEKVFTLPLDINLNKDYTYDYRGRERIGDFDCHVIDFEPIDPSRILYRGRAWIETRTFAPVKMASVQTNLKPPILSHDEQDYFAPSAGPDGATYWLLSRVEGQQILSVAGREVVLLREIDFKKILINDPGFEQARQQSYASTNQMLRDTDQGLRYLQRTEGGERQVKEETDRSVLLGLAGLYRQTGLDYPVLPAVGLEYFNFKFRGRDVQLNALVGGIVNLITLTDPSVGGKRLDATVEMLTFLPSVTDRLFVQGEEREESNVDARSQRLSGSVGLPLGNFFRVKATYDLEPSVFGRDDDTDDTFRLPSDTLTHSGALEWEFHRSAWTVTASGRRSRRGSWESWGDSSPPSPEIVADFPSSPCDSPGSCLVEFNDDQKTFDRFEFGIAKQFFLPLFQKLRFETRWFGGSRLDRFSEYQFSFFGSRVRGLSGSGVRFDRGGVARAQYSFNIADALRFDASIDHAYVKDSLVSDEFDRFTGVGVSGNLMGPWQTILQFDIGVAVQSEFDELRGNTEFLLGLLKYF